jgi:hypothetical protein
MSSTILRRLVWVAAVVLAGLWIWGVLALALSL